MKSTELIKEIRVGSANLQLVMEDQTPLIEWEGETFQHLWLLIHHMPLLCELSYLDRFAEISNFLWKGLQFEYIHSVSDYQRFYLDQIDCEKRCPSDLFRYRLTDYKIFDVSVMHPPLLEEKRLYYFVFNTSTGLPYRVVAPFPYHETSTVVHYQILPLKVG